MTKKSFTIAELAALTQSQVVGSPHHCITAVSDLDSAGEEDASFFAKPEFGQASRYEQALSKSAAGVIFVPPDAPLVEGRNYLLNSDPSRAFQVTLEAFNGTEQKLSGFSGIHATAVIHPTSKIGQQVTIGPYAVIDQDVEIGDNTHIGAHCFIGPQVKIGSQCILHPHVTVREKCVIGNRVILQPGAVIGSCGFGYTTDKQGRHIKLNQVGNVTVEDDVEIGANSTIDRSRFKTTRIGRGTKIDNLVQIGHNVNLGPHNIIVAQSGIAGSAQTGHHVVLAGQCGVTGHIKLGDRVILSARSAADKSMPDAGTYGGAPAMPMAEHNRVTVHMRNIEKYVKLLKALEARLSKLEES